MKRIFIYCALPLLTAACGRSGDFDATGTFEATEVVVSAEAAGRILRFDAEEGEFTPKTIQTRDSRANLVYAAKIAVENDGRLKIGLYGEVRLRN